MNKGETLYWVRKSTQSIEPIKVHDIRDTYFTCTAMKGSHTYLFNNYDDSVFDNLLEAEAMLEHMKKIWDEEEKRRPKGTLSKLLSSIPDSDVD